MAPVDDPTVGGLELPTVAEVVADLRTVVKLGLRDIGDSPLPALHRLPLIAGSVPNSDPIQIGFETETQVVQAVDLLGTAPDGYLRPILQALFGLDAASHGKNAKARRQLAARRAGSSGATFDRHDEARVLRSLAVQALRQDADYRRRADRAAWADRPLSEEQKAIAWEQRFGYYHRLGRAAGGLRHHVIAFAMALVGALPVTDRADQLHTSLWWYARLLVELDAFDRSPCGGRFVLLYPEAEMDASSATYQLVWHAPFNERGNSILRLTLRGVPDEELHAFARRLEDDPEGSELLGLWEQWAAECKGDFEEPDDACHAHGMVDQADRLRAVIDGQWAKVAERVRELPVS